MVNLLGDIRAYVVAFCQSWYTLMAGIFAVLMWGLGAALEPMPVSLRWSFLACGTVAAVVAGFLVWRREYRTRLTEVGHLKLRRLAGEGERLVAALESSTERHAERILGAAAGLVAWHRECLQTIKAECPRSWVHFADLGELSPDMMEAQARLLIQRIRELLDVLPRS